MKSLSLYIARRYLFAQKSHKAVNIISLISLFGFCIGTASLIIVLSVFNGFEGLITDMYNQFDPDLKVIPVASKTFSISTDDEEYLSSNTDIIAFSKVLEEQALIRYNGKQTTGIIKGVSEDYHKVTGVDSLLLHGVFDLSKQDNQGAVVGMGLANTLGIGLKFINTLVIYAPQRLGRLSLSNPENNFTSNYFFPTGLFAVYQPEIDNQYLLIGLKKAQELFQYKEEISSLEIHLSNSANAKEIQKTLSQYFSGRLIVQNRLQQKADLYKMFSMEKWIAFFIVLFILIIAIFNIVGTLSMLIIEKRKDIETLRSIGADAQFIQQIFYTEGRLIAFFGALLGLTLGIVTCLLQQHFGLIQLGASGQYIVDAYPVQLLFKDIVLVFFTVVIIGSISIYFPVKYICKRFGV